MYFQDFSIRKETLCCTEILHECLSLQYSQTTVNHMGGIIVCRGKGLKCPQVMFDLIRQISHLIVSLMWSLKLGLYFSLSKENMGKTPYCRVGKAGCILDVIEVTSKNWVGS